MARLSLRRRSAFRSGAVTGLAQIVLALAAAGAGALLAQKFGRNAQTDGFLAAYGVYLLLVLAAQALRLVVVPDLTRAAAEGRLGGETRAFAGSFLLLAIPICVVVGVFARPLGDLITGDLPPDSASVAADALRILVPAAFAQLLAALGASALAATDSYATAAGGFALGGVVGLGVFAALADSRGVVALAWGLAANALVALSVVVGGLARKRVLGTAPALHRDHARRIWKLLEGTAVPLALQGCYLLALRFAAKLGVGSVTSYSYAFLAASTLVSATAFPLGVISSAPLTRRGIGEEDAGRHIVHAAWVSLSLVGAGAGVFALIGGRVVEFVLGDAYAGDVGEQIGHLVAYLALWMVSWVGFVVTFPLVFVAGRRRLLVPIAAAGFAACIPLGLGLRELWGLPGIAIGTGIATLLITLGLMSAVSTRALAVASIGLARLALAIGAAAALTFGGLGLLLSQWAAAGVGILAYAFLIYAIRSYGLTDAVAYVRGLH